MSDEPQRDAMETSQENKDLDPAVLKMQLEAVLKEQEELRAHISDLNDENKKKRFALREEQEKRDAERAQMLAEQGKYKELYEDAQSKLERLTPIEEKYQSVLDSITQSNQQRIERIPEEFHDLIPPGLTPDQLSQWLDRAEPKLAAPRVPDIDAGARSTGSGAKAIKLTAEEKKMAANMQMTDEQYATWKERLQP